MPAGHLHRRLMSGKQDAVAYALSLGTSGNDAHWPLNDTSWSTSAGTITENLGGSDGTEDHYVDYSTAEGTHRASVGVSLGSLPGTSTLFAAAGANNLASWSGADGVQLGDVTGLVSTGTWIVFYKYSDYVNASTAFVARALVYFNSQIALQMLDNDGSKDTLVLGASATVGNCEDYKNKLLMVVFRQTDATTATFRLFADGALDTATGASATLDTSGSPFADIRAVPYVSGAAQNTWIQHCFYFYGNALTDDQLLKIHQLSL